jgi:PKD repeat protein
MKRLVSAALLTLLMLFLIAIISHNPRLSPVGVAQAQTSSLPELPRVFIDTTFTAPTGNTINVRSGDNLQSALNLAQPGDTLLLQSGATFVAPSGGFVLPAKSNPNNKWIVMRASDMSNLPPPGFRVGPQDAASMPKILSSNAVAALTTQTGAGAVNASYWRIIGVEFSVTATALADANITGGAGANTGLVRLGDPYETSAANVSHDFVIDRCYIHGNPRMNTIRGINLNSGSAAIIDSHLSDFHGVAWESQAICGWNGPGPFKIVNNYLEGASENIMFGGGDPKINGLIPSDIEIKRNYFFKPLSWKLSDPSYAGYHWNIKNSFELKNSRRVLIQGNVFENSWVDGQVGYGISIKSSNQDNSAPWSQTLDVTFTENIVRRVAIGIQVAARDNINTTQVTTRVLVRNNVFEDVNSLFSGGSGTMVRIIGGNAPVGFASTGPTYVTVDHNTGFVTSNSNGKMLEVSDVTPNFVYTNNLFDYNSYAVKGSGLADGNQTLTSQFPGVVFTKNALAGNSAASTNFSSYPGNYFPASWSSVGFVSFNNGLHGDYHLTASSPYRNQGSDGKDLGADIDALNASINAPPANQPPTASLAASPMTGLAPLPVNFSVSASDPDGFIASYSWNFGDGQTSSEASPSHVYQSAGTFSARVTVTDNHGATASATVTVNATSSTNQPPEVNVGASVTNGTAPLAVNFTSVVLDPDGLVVGYNWSFGDGQSSSEVSPTHTYLSAGSFLARLTVTDNQGATASSSVTITVSNAVARPQVTVLTPNTRVTLKFKSVYNISWLVNSDEKISSHTIELSLDGGATWRSVAQSVRGTLANYSWKVPNLPTTNARIRVTSTTAAGVSGQDMSDTSFIIIR